MSEFRSETLCKPEIASTHSEALAPGGYRLTAGSPLALDRVVSSVSSDFLFPFKSGTASASHNNSVAFFWGPDASNYFITDNVRDEIAVRFATDEKCMVTPSGISDRISRCLVRVGLADLAADSGHISPLELSGGQQQRLVAALLISRPPPLAIALNPLVYVDRAGRPSLYSCVVDAFTEAGCAFILAGETKSIEDSLALIPVTWKDSRFSRTSANESSAVAICPQDCWSDGDSSDTIDGTKAVLTLRDVEWQYPNGRRGVAVNSFSIFPGSFVAVCGPNGGGKSSLLRALCSDYGVPRRSEFKFMGDLVHNPFKELVRRGKIAMAFQDANIHAFPGTVDEAIVGRIPAGTTAHDYQLTDYLSTDLIAAPFWVKQAVSAISAISTSPQILLLDEPMDGFGFMLFGKILQSEIQRLCRAGSAVVVVTHDPELVRGHATHYAWVENGLAGQPLPSVRLRNKGADPRLLHWLGFS